MVSYGKCAYCNTAGHTLQNCVDPSIPNVINGLEQSIANRYTRRNIISYLRVQPLINVRILARKNRLSTSIQKGFLIDQLTIIYYNIHRTIRLDELGNFIHSYLLPNEPLYTWETFRIDRLAHYLYIHLINETSRMNMNIDESSTLITKLVYVSNTLNGLYRQIYHFNEDKENRYYEWMQYIFETITDMHHTVRVQLTGYLREPREEETPKRPIIIPYMLVSSSRQFRNKPERCPICYDDVLPKEKIQFKCGHMLCNNCTHQHVEHSGQHTPQCVLCRAVIREIYTTDKSIYAEWEETST
jgi:hypothetical protein